MALTSVSGQFLMTSYTWPLSWMLMKRPWGRLNASPNFWQARPTVGVYTMGISSMMFSESSL